MDEDAKVLWEDVEPKPYLDRLERAPDGSILHHFWIDDARRPDFDIAKSVLCWAHDSSLARRPGDGGLGLSVTIDKKLVNCQLCLELIHA